MRKTDIFNHDSNIIDQLASLFSSANDCEPYDYKSLMKSKRKINYRDSAQDNIKGLFIYNGKDFVSEINSIRKNLKKPRKPTEILIYTDGFSYSATSYMLKYLQYYEG